MDVVFLSTARGCATIGSVVGVTFSLFIANQLGSHWGRELKCYHRIHHFWTAGGTLSKHLNVPHNIDKLTRPGHRIRPEEYQECKLKSLSPVQEGRSILGTVVVECNRNVVNVCCRLPLRACVEFVSFRQFGVGVLNSVSASFISRSLHTSFTSCHHVSAHFPSSMLLEKLPSMFEFLSKASPLLWTIVIDNPLKKDHRIAPLGCFEVVKSIRFDIPTAPRQAVRYVCEYNKLWASYLFHPIKISFTLFLVVGLWFFWPTQSCRAADVAFPDLVRKTWVFLHCYVKPYFRVFPVQMECSPDKSTSRDGIGRRRLVASLVETSGGESLVPLRRSCFTRKNRRMKWQFIG